MVQTGDNILPVQMVSSLRVGEGTTTMLRNLSIGARQSATLHCKGTFFICGEVEKMWWVDELPRVAGYR